VVLVAERLEDSNRESMFPDVFGMAKDGLKCMEGGKNHGFDGDCCTENLVTIGTYRVMLQAVRRGPSDLGGSVMS